VAGEPAEPGHELPSVREDDGWLAARRQELDEGIAQWKAAAEGPPLVLPADIWHEVRLVLGHRWLEHLWATDPAAASRLAWDVYRARLQQGEQTR
jgi:hypothetical protein